MCRNKKQESRKKKKIEQKKLEGKSLDIGDAGLKDVSPRAWRHFEEQSFFHKN